MDKYQKGAAIGIGLGVIWGIIYWQMRGPFTRELVKLFDEWGMATIGGRLSKMGIDGVYYFIAIGALGGWLFAYIYTGFSKDN